MRRKMILVPVLVLLMIFAMTPLLSLRVNAGESNVETTDIQPEGVVFSETFEGAFPGTAWTVGDSNSGNGYDYWDDTSYRAHLGSWSGWCAQVGTQAAATTIFTETFEGAWPGSWYVGDWDSTNGYDYWGDSSVRCYTGSWSGWCNDYPTPTATSYDDYMHAYMYRNVGSLSSYSTVYLSYYYWLQCETNYDYLQVMYYSGGTWYYIDIHTGNLGNTWYPRTVAIPTTATSVGFFFHSDYSVSSLMGAYVDAVTLYGYGYPNNLAHKYDLDMQAYMYRYYSLSAYSSATLNYYYWLNSESGYDYLYVRYYSGGTWYYIDSRTGNSGGWQYSSVSIPTTATYVGFYFYSDSIIANYEGAYIDDVSLVGTRSVANSLQHKYDNYMDAYMYRATSLSAYSSATLNYYYWLNSESGFDYLRVMYYSGGTWYYIDSRTGNSGGWQYSSVSIPTTATYVGFYFYSDLSVAGYEGAYIDDIVLTGTVATYSATINAYCNTEAAYVSVPITKDGSPTGYNTPYTFTLLTGTHTFTVPSKDGTGHHFKQWSTGSTSTTITVSSAGTYTAYYETPSFDIWTNKATYTIGETMYVYVQVRNIGPATPVRAIIKLGLPNGGTYGPLLDMTTTLPASFDSGTYLWNSFTIPTAPLGTYTWIAELRNPTTSALIDSDTWIWTLT
jgi:hypothetical protein